MANMENIKIGENKKTLEEVLLANMENISVNVKNIEQFKRDILSLASNIDLNSKIAPKELIEFCVELSINGINISQVYIVPFNTTFKKYVDGVEYEENVVIPQCIMPLEAIQEECYKSNFYLRVYEVYDLGEGAIVAESEMTRAQQKLLNTIDGEWMNKHFHGFDVVLQDLEGKIPTQTKFVEATYVVGVTKTLKDERFKNQSYRHKAARRAMGDFMIPHARRAQSFQAMEKINDKMLEKHKVEDIPKLTLEELGLESKIQDGFEVIPKTKNQLTHRKQLLSMGFIMENGQWKKKIVETEVKVELLPSIEVLPPETIPTPPPLNKETKEISPAMALYAYLLSKGLNKEQCKDFSNNILGVTKENEQDIIDILDDMESLDCILEDYCAA